jgi:uncharacterized protein YndB with AHSA1/START domain
MSAKVESTVLIHRPAAEVFAFATDWDKYPMWESDVLEMRQLSPGPTGVGTTFRHVARFMGQRLEIEGVVTAYEPGRRICFKTTKASFPFSACQTFHEEDGATRATYTFEAELGGLLRLLQPLTLRMSRRTLEANYVRLKDILEAKSKLNSSERGANAYS